MPPQKLYFTQQKPPLQNSASPSCIEFKTRKHFQVAGYWIFKNSKFTIKICLLGFWLVWSLCASLSLLSSIRLFFMQRNHINVSIFQSTLSLSSVCRILDATKRLHIGQVQIRYIEYKIQAKWQHRYMHCHFILESSASFLRIKNENKDLPCPPLASFKLCRMQSQIYVTTVEVGSPQIEQSHNTHCIATCYNKN